jgi:hypothetical protein
MLLCGVLDETLALPSAYQVWACHVHVKAVTDTLCYAACFCLLLSMAWAHHCDFSYGWQPQSESLVQHDMNQPG